MRKRNERLTLRLTTDEKQNIINYANLIGLNINIAIINLIERELKKHEEKTTNNWLMDKI